MNKFNKKLTISVPEESECSQDETLGMGKPQPPDKESLLQFRDFRDGVDSEGGETRQEHPSNRLNYVQFEEFSISKFNPRENLKSEGDSVKTPKHKRNFTIELPDRDGEKGNQKKLKTQQLEGAQVQREPPAPPKGSRTSKVFVFPNSPHKEEESSDIMKQSFQRERQEFYREKSRLEKQILIKNGQIDMLQKIVKEKYSFQSLTDKRYQSFNSEEGFQRMQRILLEKDLEINELLEKIAYLNEALEKKSEEFNKRLIENATLETLIESLRNQIYIYEKKDNNEKLSKKFFYYQKERERANEWVENDLDISMGHIDYGRKGIEQLNKRIQMIRNNRKEINSRQKINSEYSSYSQSTKNRPKGAFDFKSKMHEDSKLNRTRMF